MDGMIQLHPEDYYTYQQLCNQLEADGHMVCQARNTLITNLAAFELIKLNIKFQFQPNS